MLVLSWCMWFHIAGLFITNTQFSIQNLLIIMRTCRPLARRQSHKWFSSRPSYNIFLLPARRICILCSHLTRAVVFSLHVTVLTQDVSRIGAQMAHRCSRHVNSMHYVPLSRTSPGDLSYRL